ncbi:MAG: hypothetical protein ACTTH5_06195 [Wolinella sp.]
MRKMVLGLAVLVGLMCVEALGFTSEKIKNDYETKCKNGDGKACYSLGTVYYTGAIDSGIDYKKAEFYYKKVCKKGNNINKDEGFEGACLNLGAIYDEGGYGNQKNSEKFLKIHTIGCEGGNMGVMRHSWRSL